MKAENNNTNLKKSNIRMVLVIIFILIYGIVNYINIRGEYLYNLELGSQYVEKFMQSLNYKVVIAGVNFVFLFIVFDIVTVFIKK